LTSVRIHKDFVLSFRISTGSEHRRSKILPVTPSPGVQAIISRAGTIRATEAVIWQLRRAAFAAARPELHPRSPLVAEFAFAGVTPATGKPSYLDLSAYSFISKPEGIRNSTEFVV
jgi:hypothetical protein